MTDEVLSVLSEAIKARRCCALRYRDQTQARVVEPHAIYQDATGEVIVDCYQIGGYSSADRNPPFWRPFRARKITAVALLQKPFVARRSEGFSPTRLRYRTGLICLVSETEEALVRTAIPRSDPVGPFLPQRARRR